MYFPEKVKCVKFRVDKFYFGEKLVEMTETNIEYPLRIKKFLSKTAR